MSKCLKEWKNEAGFTLVELLIVIIILAILGAIVVFAVGTTAKSASAAACDTTVKSVQTALAAYKAQANQYPPLLATLTAPKTLTGAKAGPWLHTVPPSTLTGGAKYAIVYAYTGATTTGTVSVSYKTGALTVTKAADTATANPCTKA